MNNNKQFFSERGFGRELGVGENPALIVIDMLNAFTNESMPLGTNQDSQIEVINRILVYGRHKGYPILFVTISYDDKDLSDAGLWLKKMQGLNTLKSNTFEVQIDKRISVMREDAIIRKKFASAFFGTDLITRLIGWKVDTLIITGCTTSGCVRATAVDAMQYGFRPIIIEDAVSDRSLKAHKQSLFDLNAKYADVVHSDKIIITDFMDKKEIK
jgi:maleamate amidohydrolase